MKRQLLIWLSCMPTILFSQHDFGSFRAYSDYAVQHNPDLTRSLLNMAVEQQNYRSAISPLLPSARASINLTDNLVLPTQLIPKSLFGGPTGTYSEVRFGTKYNFAPGFEGSVNLINGANWQNLKIAGAGQSLAAVNYQLNREELLKNLAALYYSHLLARQNLVFAKRNQEIASEIYKSSKDRYDNGLIDELELSRSRNLQLNQEQLTSQSTSILEKTLLDLKLAANIPFAEDLNIKDSIQLQTGNSGMNFIAEERPQYLASATKARIASMTLLREKLRFLPELSAFANYNWQAQNNEFKFFSSSQHWYKSSAIGLRLDVPLFAGASRIFNVARAQLNEKIAKSDMEYARMKVEKEWLEYNIDLRRFSGETRLSSEQLGIAQKNYELAQLKFENGVLAYDALQNVFKELLMAQQQYLDKVTSYTITNCKIQFATSKP